MDGQEKYVAYVGTYTHGSSIGIHVYDIDIEAGIMTEREVIPVNNASHMTKSYNGKYLYSIADEGVEVLAISPDGSLEPINKSVSMACAAVTSLRTRAVNFSS